MVVIVTFPLESVKNISKEYNIKCDACIDYMNIGEKYNIVSTKCYQTLSIVFFLFSEQNGGYKNKSIVIVIVDCYY